MLKNNKAMLVVMGLLGFVLVADALVLFAYKKFNFGTIVPFFIGVIFLVHARYWSVIVDYLEQKKLLKKAWQALWFVFLIWFVSFIIFVGCLSYEIKNQSSQTKVVAVIALGAGVNGNKPTPTLARRLDAAATIMMSDITILPIVSGGMGFQKSHSEAFVMANYLHSKYRIDYKRIIQEDKSTSTDENLIFSKVILKTKGIKLTQPIAIVTSDFHTIRAKAIAKKKGYKNIVMVASQTPKSIVFNAWFREYFAYISGWFLGEY